ncbi:Eukaryotic peptide chain release factor GTP-binding subunit ERF3A [Lemmus lemmus]
MRISALPSARNSPSTPSPLSPTSTLKNSCHPSCGVQPNCHHPLLVQQAVTTEQVEEIPTTSVPKKEHVNVIFFGHVDAGKATTGGQIMY